MTQTPVSGEKGEEASTSDVGDHGRSRTCATGELQPALTVLTRGTKAGNAALDMAASIALIHGCCKGGDVAGARRVFDVTPLLGVAP
jgi:hypothetical protein